MEALGWGRIAWGKVLSIILIGAILGALGTLVYVITTPKVSEKFTEFYILGLGGKATDYPAEITVGEEGRVIIGIVNHEHEAVSYRVEVKINGVSNNDVGPVVLDDEGKWEEIVGFTPDAAEYGQKVEFLLYKDAEPEPYCNPLRLWVDVVE